MRTLYVAMTRAKDRLVVAGRWPAAPEEAGRSNSHMELLAQRAPSEGLAALAADLLAGGGRHADRDGARWVFPALGAAGDGAAATAAVAPPLPAPGQVARDAERLAGLRAEAAARMASGVFRPRLRGGAPAAARAAGRASS